MTENLQIWIFFLTVLRRTPSVAAREGYSRVYTLKNIHSNAAQQTKTNSGIQQ